VGTYAQESSQTLGTGVVNDSSAALLSLAEDYLVSTVDDQAAIADVVFVDTDSEMDILSAQVAQLQQNPPVQSLVPIYPEDNPPADPDSGALLIFAPTAIVTPDSPEAKTLAGLAGALKAVYQSDSDMTSIYIATDSGMMLMYPGNGMLPKKFDPRTRSWYSTGSSAGYPGMVGPAVRRCRRERADDDLLAGSDKPGIRSLGDRCRYIYENHR